MNKDLPKEIAARKKRWEELYAGRRLSMLQAEYPAANQMERPLPWPELKKQRIEYAWQGYCARLERLQVLDDDTIPSIAIETGTEIFAESFGCKVHRPYNDMPFALPVIFNYSDIAKVKDTELSSSSLTRLFDMADELYERSDKEAVFRLPDIQSPMDITALIWDKTDLYVALIENPAAVLEVSAKVTRLLCAFLDEWFKRYGRSFIAHYPYYYMPCGVTLSEDEIGAIGPEMFSEFFLPELNRLSERYGGIGVHCCATARHQWEGLSRIKGLKLLNLNLPQNEILPAVEYFENITVQMHNWEWSGNPWELPQEFPPNTRAVYSFQLKNKEEALRVCEHFARLN